MLSMIIGIDDTDSKKGMCTTYIAAVLMDKLRVYGTIKEYPLLIRLNPNIRYKTRGNAAIALQLELKNSMYISHVKELVSKMVENMAVLSDENTNPGIVFIEQVSEKLVKCLRNFSMHAVQDVLNIKEAIDVLESNNIEYVGFKNKRGIIGATAAAGFVLTGLPDFTYELIAYRERKRWGMPRNIDEDSVYQAHAVTYPNTWDTVDLENRRIVCAPHSPDPILLGIRGNSETAVRYAFSKIRCEPIERCVVYKTNQNTDMHLIHARIKDVKQCRSYILNGMVCTSPRTIKGGHVIFEITENGASLSCIAFEPTKGFRNIIRQLRIGDHVTVYGSVKDTSLNLEKINITSLNPYILRNPVCCGKRMKSMGKGKGYRCEKCGAVKHNQMKQIIHRDISLGLYEVPPSARRHLSKPIVRILSHCSE